MRTPTSFPPCPKSYPPIRKCRMNPSVIYIIFIFIQYMVDTNVEKNLTKKKYTVYYKMSYLSITVIETIIKFLNP